MRAKVAVATVNGKAYFLIVNELKQRNISFLSLIPGESVPAQVKVVISTQEERFLMNHQKILIYDPTDLNVIGSEIIKILQGKEIYETVVIGVDPGEVIGIAAIADGTVIFKENCFSLEETLNSIKNILKTVDASKSAVTVKIGNGVPVFRELLAALDKALPFQISLEIVGEAGTNKHTHGLKNGRTLRHVVSAQRIAEREGYICSRGKSTIEQNS